MNIKILTREDSATRLQEYFNNKNSHFDSLNNDYKQLRDDLNSLFKTSRVFKDNDKLDEYKTDLSFALKLYDYLNSKSWFNDTIASNYNFWSYLSINVVPDIVEERHGDNASYYYEKNVRIYLSTMWWYINMSYQGDINDTKVTLENLNTDCILQLVERPGRDGTYITVSRTIMKYFGKIPKRQLSEKVDGKTLLRRVMIQNTSQIENYNLVFDGEEDLYVKNLFKACKVDLDIYE